MTPSPFGVGFAVGALIGSCLCLIQLARDVSCLDARARAEAARHRHWDAEIARRLDRLERACHFLPPM